MLEAAIMKHLRLLQEVYDLSDFRPKHHYATHLAEMLEWFGCLISCFVHERHHRLVKNYMRFKDNTTSYELGTVEDITIHQLMDLENDFLAHGFGDGREPSASQLHTLRELWPSAQRFLVASNIFADGLTHVGDVVYCTSTGGLVVGELLLLVETDGVRYAVVSIWPLLEDDECCSKHETCVEPQVCPIELLVTSLMFRVDGEIATVLKPVAYRCCQML